MGCRWCWLPEVRDPLAQHAQRMSRKLTHAGDRHGVAAGQVTRADVDRRAIARPGPFGEIGDPVVFVHDRGLRSMTAAEAGAARNTNHSRVCRLGNGAGIRGIWLVPDQL